MLDRLMLIYVNTQFDGFIMRSRFNILKQGLSYLKKKINRSYTIFTRDPESGEFKLATAQIAVKLPQNMGYILALTHDRREDENEEYYKNRCVAQVKQHIQQGYYTFFACSTIIRDEPVGTIDSVIQKFKEKKTLSQSEGKAVTPGHIALYTNEKEFISHTPAFKQTQDEAIEYDVKKSFQEQQQVSTYLVVLSEDCFSYNDLKKRIRQERTIRQNRDSYHWGAVDSTTQKKDNCATRIQLVFLGNRNLNTMNPLDTLQAVIARASTSRSLTDDDHDTLAICYETTGINRTIPAVSWDENLYRSSLISGNKNQSLSNLETSQRLLK